MKVLEIIGGILLIVLRIIGMIFLKILGFLMIVLLSVLFVPIRYRGKIKGDTNTKEISGEAGISWFLHFISIKVWFEENKTRYFLKVLGIRVFDSEKKVEETKAVEPDDEKTQNNEKQNKETLDEETKNEEIQALETKPDDEKAREKTGKAKSKVKRDTKRKTVKDFIEKLKKIRDKKNEYVSFLSTRESRQAIKRIKEILFNLFRHILPKKISGNVSYGFTEPDITGKSFGILMMLFNGRLSDINIDPQFNDVEKIFVSGDVKFKGRIRLVVILKTAVKLYRTKRLREFINFVKESGK